MNLVLFIFDKFKKIYSNSHWIWKKSEKDMIFVHAASLTYSTFLNLIPLFAVAYYFFDFLGGFDQLQKEVESFISENLAPQFADEILTYLEIIRSKISPKAMGAFGVVGFIVSGILLLSKIEFSFNSIWSFQKTRPWSHKITTYWTMISLGPIFIGISVITSREIFLVLQDSTNLLAISIVSVLSVIPYLTSTMLLMGMFMWLPAVRVSWKIAFIAAIITSFLFEGLKQFYAFYAAYALKNSIYGTLAVLPVFMIWINLIWVVILLGAQICFYLSEKPTKKTKPIED